MRVGIDWSYGEVPRTVMVGSGEAWASVAGRTVHGTWTKDAAAAPIVLTADDGSPLRLAPGNTWIELVPNEGSAAFAPERAEPDDSDGTRRAAVTRWANTARCGAPRHPCALALVAVECQNRLSTHSI
jgi:hypothetical protein